MRQKSLKGIALTDATGSVAERYEYDDYGRLLDAASLEEFDGQPLTDFTYTGQLRDQESGLYQMRNRYYSPAVGKFISYDPLGFVDGMNRTAYVNSNPTSRVDPLGLFTFEVAAGELAGWDTAFDAEDPAYGSIRKTNAHARNMRYTKILLAFGTIPSITVDGILGSIRDMPQSTTFLARQHLSWYIYGDGTDKYFNAGKMLKEDEDARKAMINALFTLRRAFNESKRLGRGKPALLYHGHPEPADKSGPYPKGPFTATSTKWHYAIAGFFARAEARVACDPQTGNYGANIRLELADRYNFHYTNKGVVGALVLSDNELAELHAVGLAHAYNLIGSHIYIKIEDVDSMDGDEINEQLIGGN